MPKKKDMGKLYNFSFVPGSDSELILAYVRVEKKKVAFCAAGTFDLDTKRVFWYDEVPGYCMNEAVVSPDKSKVAFTVHKRGDTSFVHQLGIMDIDGGNREILTESELYKGQLSFSPSGKKIVYTTSKAYQRVGRKQYIEGYDLFEYDFERKKEERLSDFAIYQLVQPLYYMDDDHIIFSMYGGVTEFSDKSLNATKKDPSLSCTGEKFKKHLKKKVTHFYDGGFMASYDTIDSLIFICDLRPGGDVTLLFDPKEYNGMELGDSGLKFGTRKGHANVYTMGLSEKRNVYFFVETGNWKKRPDNKGAYNILLYDKQTGEMRMIVNLVEEVYPLEVMRDYLYCSPAGMSISANNGRMLLEGLCTRKSNRSNRHLYFLRDMQSGKTEHFDLVGYLYQASLRSGE